MGPTCRILYAWASFLLCEFFHGQLGVHLSAGVGVFPEVFLQPGHSCFDGTVMGMQNLLQFLLVLSPAGGGCKTVKRFAQCGGGILDPVGSE